jgi:hypothetical protein
VLIYKWVPIIGPVLGSAFVIGLYVAARLLKGDLTDRMKMMDEVSTSYSAACWDLSGLWNSCLLEAGRMVKAVRVLAQGHRPCCGGSCRSLVGPVKVLTVTTQSVCVSCSCGTFSDCAWGVNMCAARYSLLHVYCLILYCCVLLCTAAVCDVTG